MIRIDVVVLYSPTTLQIYALSFTYQNKIRIFVEILSLDAYRAI